MGVPSPQTDSHTAPATALKLLKEGAFSSCALWPTGSNYVFLAQLTHAEGTCLAIYKPRSGEIPLWDFPEGTLWLREYAAYVLSQLLGWGFIPSTILRNGPHGAGSLQLFVEYVPEENYFSLRRQRAKELQRIAVFDFITNNADRKASHCLLGTDGWVWAIDHGLTFNTTPKLRTVIWDFQGQPVPLELLQQLERFYASHLGSGSFAKAFAKLLSPREIDAFARRVELVLELRTFPPYGRRAGVPWPPV